MKLIIFGLVLLISYGQSSDPRVDPLVLIDQGLVRGEKSSDGEYSTFMGIPYAEVDSTNPFGDALPAPSFGDEVFNAYDGSISCPQAADSSTLDCLRVNIYVPTKANSRNPLPVMFWIHGGTFKDRSASLYDGRLLAAHDIVVVTINYRLGPYGFMCLDVPSVPGNTGLKDQYRALRWVRQNIAAFGGNPYNITIAGEGAGGASVNYHLYSDNEKIFHKAIFQSGVAQMSGLYTSADERAAVKLSTHLGFNTSDTEQALNFLATTSPNLVIAATSDLNLKLRPCKERSFSGVSTYVENDPMSLSNTKKISSTPILIGSTSQEADFANINYDSDPFYEILEANFNLDENELATAAALIRHFYIGDTSDLSDVETEILHFLSDFDFNHPIDRTIQKLLSEGAGSIYEYIFSYVSENDAGDRENRYARHMAELKYIFNENPEALNEEEKYVADQTTKLWADFIKFGNPTRSSSIISWPSVSSNSRPYVDIDVALTIRNRFENKAMAFWDLFYAHYGNYSNILRQCSL